MLLNTNIIETIEPANLKAILATKFHDWEVGVYRHRAFRPVKGTNIFTSDGAFWQHSKALFQPQFTRELINDLDSTEKATGVLFEAIGKADKDGWTSTVDVKPLLFRFVLNTATEFLFGESIESQKALMLADSGEGVKKLDLGSVAGSTEFAEAFDICSYYMVVRVRLQQCYFFGNY